jgi:hypothetical protein
LDAIIELPTDDLPVVAIAAWLTCIPTRISFVMIPAAEFFPGKMARMVCWYDNEWGYSCHVGDGVTDRDERELSAPLA